ncbi:TPM domain-containing protein [uncultured Lactobacillus sp.]|uniref:TPM domain-containing protein n=1 Tax=uncultured Lactobacillus sp. TaxID=153152 RepID=UPI002601603A|nr:TPM domain-containing protein [uncultured Lactobacillus sp.]
MKNKVFCLFFLPLMLLLMAMGSSSVKDPLNFYNDATRQLVETKNNYYRKTKAKPQIILVSVKNDDQIKEIKPKAKQVIIATGHSKNDRKNVQILVGKSLEKVLSQTQISNIIRYAGKDLRSSKSSTFNKGIALVINACTTLVDQKYSFPGDKNTLTQEQMQKINHPQSVNLVWGIVIAVIATAAFSWYQHWKIKN